MLNVKKDYPKNLVALLDTLPDLTPHENALIERAYIRAESAHENQKRKSGEPYFTHCVAVAGILADLGLDAEAVAAGLLHDTIEDTDVTLDMLVKEFGVDIANLVDGVTKLTQLPIERIGRKSDTSRKEKTVNREMEYLRKMFLTMDDDVRVVLIKLADRLHNMRTLGYVPEKKQRRIAQQTLDIFAPLANRLGIWQIKWELEDLSFRYLEPDAYRAIARSLDERRPDREAYVSRVADLLRAELAKYGLYDVQITARPKHIHSIYKKMTRKAVPLEKIYDVRAVRVIVPEEHQCYTVLGIVHGLWLPIPGEFDDYIAAPKDNFYRSLHTAVHDGNGKTLEVQIRTKSMHEDAEYGIAAHWRYKEGSSRNVTRDKKFQDRIAYLRRLMDVNERLEEDAETFVSRMRSEVFEDRVYAITPKGDLIDLPVGATPVDFAYLIHTDVGHRCRGAKINGKLMPLNYQLKTGDQVEIVTAKRGGPSMDWLNPDLGYLKTSRARAKVRHWLRKQNREQHIQIGRGVLEREMKRMSVLDRLSFEAVAHMLDYDNVEDFLAAIGAGDVNGAQITNKILEEDRLRQESEKSEIERVKPRPRSAMSVQDSSGVSIMGTSGLQVNIANCCSPVAGDLIIGYVTRGRGVTVHRQDCPNMQNLSDPERLIEVSWDSVTDEHTYEVPIEVITQDRGGLLRDISTAISDEKINITSVEVVTRQQIATIYLSVEISNSSQLLRILNKVEMIPSVYEARRSYQRK